MTIALNSEPTKRIESYAAFSLITCLTGLLLVIWPIPNTIAVRQILLAVLFIALVTVQKKDIFTAFQALPKYISLLFLLLTGWLIFHSAFLAVESANAFSNLSSQWLRFTISILTGILLGLYIFNQKRHRCHQFRADTIIFSIISIAFIIHLGATVYSSILNIAQSGQIDKRISGITGGPENISYLANYALCISLAAYIFIVREQNFEINKKRALLAASFISLLAFANLYLSAMRNGIICAIVMLLACVIFIIIRSSISKRTKLAGSVFALMFISVLSYVQLQDSRWSTLVETLPISWDTEGNMAWLDKRIPLPKLQNGQTVSHSNYKRIAWIKEGGLLIVENPLGYGFNRNIFGIALADKYNIDKEHISSIHSHSGLIDFTMATGIPGGLLLYTFFVLLTLYGLKMSIKSPYLILPGFGLTLLVINFATRSVLDSVLRDHMFEMFMFLAGLLLAYTAISEKNLKFQPLVNRDGI